MTGAVTEKNKVLKYVFCCGTDHTKLGRDLDLTLGIAKDPDSA